MLLLLPFIGFTFCFLSNHVAALNITVQSNTIVGQPSLVLWAREPSDGNGPLVFDLRFVKPDNDEDVGLALANIQAPPSIKFGTVQVVFHSPMSYLLVAVSGPNFTKIGQSGKVNAFQIQTTSSLTLPPTSTSQPVPSATTSSATIKSTSTASTVTLTSHKKKIGAIVGGTLGGVAFLGLLAALGIMLLRRLKAEKKTRKWSFHGEKMVLPPVLDISRFSTSRMPPRPQARPPTLRIPSRRMTETSMYSQFSSQEGVYKLPSDDILSTFPIVMMESPTLPRMAYPRERMAYPRPRPLPERPERPEPLRPLPPPPDQAREGLVVHMEQRRTQTTELPVGRNSVMTQRISLDDSQKKIKQ